MSLFLSTFINKIDKKGRISVPATFRASLSSQSFPGIIAFRSYKAPAIEGFGLDRMARLSQTLDTMDLFSDAQDNLASAIFADAQQLAFDSEGRILLPQELLEHAGITEQAAFVGRGPTFQIWNPETFQAYQNEARTRIKANPELLKIRLAQGGQE